jgi:hypothetical protein
MRNLSIALAVILLGACAAGPTAPPAAVPPAAAVATGTPAAKAAVTPPATGVPPGYRLVDREGVRMLCTRRTESGSRLNKETCMTEAQYREMQIRGEDVWQDVDNSVRMRPTCTSGSCGGSSN